MNYYVYIVLLIGSLVSCSESSRHFPRYEDFPDEKVLNAQVIHLDTALFRYPFRIAVKDGIAIIMDLHNVDYFFHAFSYPEWEYMTSFWQTRRGTRRNGIGRLLPVYLQGFYLDARCEQNANNPVED